MTDFHDGERIGPGIYDVGGGSIHIDADEMCAHFGVPCTDENFRTLVSAVFDVADEFDIPEVKVSEDVYLELVPRGFE